MRASRGATWLACVGTQSLGVCACVRKCVCVCVRVTGHEDACGPTVNGAPKCMGHDVCRKYWRGAAVPSSLLTLWQPPACHASPGS